MRKLFIALVLFAGSTVCQARDMVVVLMNPQAPAVSLERNDIADVLLGRRSMSLKGVTLVPIDTRDEALREAFYQRIAKMSSNRVRAYWARRVFSSQGRPPQELSVDEAANLMLRDLSVLIYAFADRIPPGGQVLLQLEE